MNYLGINLTKYVQELYEESYRTLMKEFNELNKLKDTTYSWVGKPNIVKMSVLLNLIYRFNVIPVPNPLSYFVPIDRHFKVYMERKRPSIANSILKEKNKFRRLTLLYLKTCYKARVIKSVWYRQID
jgi:hypothetical protein